MPEESHAKLAQKAGLALWMERVLEECDRASGGFAPDPVHDLRVALRRCRSMVDGLMVMDPDPAWRQMKKSGKRLFQSLGDLRDVQVMEEWVHHFDSPGDVAASRLFDFLAARETELKQQAATALEEFDRKQWKKWCATLPRRAARLRPGSLMFQHLALERWTRAHELHGRALRNQTQAGWHSLRIGIKRFRYIVENFLPEQHSDWGGDLKKLQDLLGEVHDLDVLWDTARQANAFPDEDCSVRWHSRIQEERARRLEGYREKMVGKASLWQVWRAELPEGRQIERAALQRLRRWASVLDPDFKHTDLVTRLALQLYDGLERNGGKVKPPGGDARDILRLAAMLHDVGLSKEAKGHHKVTNRLVQRLTPPLGISAKVLHMAGVVARYHRGALPRAGQKWFRDLAAAQRDEATWLAGIFRLANALDADHKGRILRVEVSVPNGFVEVAAQGYAPRDRLAEKIAASRHLLELVCRRPVMVKTLRASRPVPRRTRPSRSPSPGS